MWSYVMAAARGDPRRRPGSVFTVQSTNSSGPPGPCRDGLNCSRYPLNASYNNKPSNSYSRDELRTNLSRDGSRDVLAEVRVQTPYSERCQSPSERGFTRTIQMGAKNPSTASCEDMMVNIDLPGEKMQNIDIKILEHQLKLNSPNFCLTIPLPHPVNPQVGNAKWDNINERLTVTLRLNRELDYINL